MTTMIASTVRPALLGAWARATIGLLAAYCASTVFLVILKIAQGDGFLAPVAILGALALTAAAVLALTRSRNACGAAVVVTALSLAASLPHYVDDITGHAGDTGRQAFGVLSIAVLVASGFAAAVATWRWNATSASV